MYNSNINRTQRPSKHSPPRRFAPSLGAQPRRAPLLGHQPVPRAPLRVAMILRGEDVGRHGKVLGHVLVGAGLVAGARLAVRIVSLVRARLLLRVLLRRRLHQLALYQPRELAALGALALALYVQTRVVERRNQGVAQLVPVEVRLSRLVDAFFRGRHSYYGDRAG